MPSTNSVDLAVIPSSPPRSDLRGAGRDPSGSGWLYKQVRERAEAWSFHVLPT